MECQAFFSITGEVHQGNSQHLQWTVARITAGFLSLQSLYRCRFSQMLKPTFEQTANILKEEFPVCKVVFLYLFSHDILL